MRTQILFVCLLSLAAITTTLRAEVEVTIDRNPVAVNESFQIVFSAAGSPSQEPDFSPLQQHFLILGNNRSNNISIINGDYRRSIKWTLQLMAKQPGEHSIPAISFGDESSKPFQVSVNPPATTSNLAGEQVLEMNVDSTEVKVQSQVILTLRLLSATDISAYQFGDIETAGLDLVIEPLGDVRQYQTRIADRAYLVLEKEFALFPQQSGRIEIPAISAEVRLMSRSALDPFNSAGPIRRVSSEPLTLEVEPVPADFGGRYWLPANRIELREEWSADLDSLVAGEPVTRSIALIADGLTAAQLPEIRLAEIAGVNQYPDKPSLKDSLGRSGVVGQRFQEIALIPGAAGSYTIPEVTLDWWNRNTGKTETLRLPARQMRVSVGVTGTDIEAPEATLPEVTDTVPVDSKPVAAVNRFWIWFSLFAVIMLVLSNLYWWRQARTREPATRPVTSADLSSARRALQQACVANESTRARRALLLWAQALLAPQRLSNLTDVSRILGADMELAVDALNRSRYAPAREAWDGAALWQLCQQLEHEWQGRPGEAESELLPLNP